MAMVNFKKGLIANLPATFAEGTFYVTTDEHAIYLDVSDSSRIRLGDFQEFANLATLQANANPSTNALYYVTDINCLAKWNGSEYIQINRDTGMTSVEVIGDGNAVTAAVYDAAGRKLTMTKGATYMTAVDVDGKIAAKVGDLTLGDVTYETVKAYVDKKTDGIATDTALETLTGRVTTAEGEIDALQEAVGAGGSIDTRITNAINALDKTDTAVDGQYVSAVSEDNGVVTVTRASLPDYTEVYDAKGAATTAESNAKAYADGLAGNYDANGAADDALADAKKYADNKVAALDFADTAVSGQYVSAVNETDGVISVTRNTLTDYTVTVTESSPEGYAKAYTIAQAATGLSTTINIPKDMVVESGSVVTDPNGQPAGTYLKLVLANATEDEIFINVGDLIEYVTSGSSAGDMVVIAVSDDHKVTATITDGSITLAKLSTEVQTAIDKAHSHENADVLDGINTAKVAAWDAAEQNAKNYADSLADDYDAAGTAAQALTDAKAYADGLSGNYDAKGAAATAESNAKDYADQKISALDKADAAVSGQYVSAVSEVDGVITVARAALPDYSNTYEAKGAAATAEENAKDYMDGLLTWGAF